MHGRGAWSLGQGRVAEGGAASACHEEEEEVAVVEEGRWRQLRRAV